VIQGERVNLRRLEEEDLEKELQWLSDPEVTRLTQAGYSLPVTRAQVQEMFKEAIRGERLFFAVETKDGTLIGDAALHPIDEKNRLGELLITIGEKGYWNKGYGTDTILLLLKLAFQEVNLQKVELRVFEYNERAIKVYEKCGFKREGVRRRALFRDGRYYDQILMGILREEFTAGFG
jgi:RimJ/RimL family protein N-acetyltransferase